MNYEQFHPQMFQDSEQLRIDSEHKLVERFKALFSEVLHRQVVYGIYEKKKLNVPTSDGMIEVTIRGRYQSNGVEDIVLYNYRLLFNKSLTQAAFNSARDVVKLYCFMTDQEYQAKTNNNITLAKFFDTVK